MKRIRRVSLENFDKLSCDEASTQVGGQDTNGGGQLPHTTPFMPTPSITPPPKYDLNIGSGGLGGTYNGDNWTGNINVNPGTGSGSIGIGLPVKL